MKIAFYVFSASGNTRKVCGRIAEELIGKGNEVSVFSIAKNAKYSRLRSLTLCASLTPCTGSMHPFPC